MTIGELLDFESAWPRHSHAKELAIRARGLTPARYYVLLRRAASSLEGQAHDAITAHRVTRGRSRTPELTREQRIEAAAIIIRDEIERIDAERAARGIRH